MPRFAPFRPLNTSRLALVAMSPEHASGLFACAGDAEISRLVASPCHESIQESRRFIADCMVRYARGRGYQWGVMRRADETFIGVCGFGEIDFQNRVGEIYYLLARRYWGQGYATEAAAAVVEFGFLEIGLQVIEAKALPENTHSFRVMTKLGMRYRESRALEEESGESHVIAVWQLARERWVLTCRQGIVTDGCSCLKYGTRNG